MKISMILDKIDERQLFVPAFQREYVWGREDVKSLVDSLIKGYPTGTMLTWETASPPELKGTYKYNENQGAVRVLLDGQQRITSLYLLMRGSIPPYYTQADIKHETRRLHVNVETLELSYYQKARMASDPCWCDLTDIFQKKTRGKDVVHALEARGEEVPRERDDLIDDNLRLIENIPDRDFPEQMVPVKATVREAINIFYKVNASGIALTEAELALAQICGYWPQARQEFKKKLSSLSDGGFVFKLDLIVYMLLACLYHLGSDMRKLHGEENNGAVRAAWQELEGKTIDYVVNLLRTHAFVDHSSEINSPYALVPMIAYCYERRSPLDEQEIQKMIKWFYYSQGRQRYKSELPQKLDRDLRIVAESNQPFDELLAVIAEERGLQILPEEFIGANTQNPLFGLMRWYFKSRGAVCLTTGVGLRRNMGSKYQLEYDHIFPYANLKAMGYGQGNGAKYALSQEITNRAILTQLANRTKSAQPAADYLQGVKKRFPHALELQVIPEGDGLWELDRYEDFLKARRVLLAAGLNRFLSEITETAEPARPASIEDIIAAGENDTVEFKSSLRWDYERGVVNKKLEEVVAKTAAAFANTEGGTLLIGVDDDGGILGLENDYASLSGDRDKFEVHLRNLLTRQFGVPFVSQRVAISFPVLDDNEICQMEIGPSAAPLIVKATGDNGQEIQRFYVRSGNSSHEVPLTQINDYFRGRFN
jgi:hypothetical protein